MVRSKGHFTGLQSSLTLAEQRRYLELEDIFLSYAQFARCKLAIFLKKWAHPRRLLPQNLALKLVRRFFSRP